MKTIIGFLVLFVLIFFGRHYLTESRRSSPADTVKTGKVSNNQIDMVKSDISSDKMDSQDNKQILKEQPQSGDVKKLSEGFNNDFILEESGKMNDSENQDWWVNSGAFLYVGSGTGKTIQGDLKKGDKWQADYKDYNSSETDTGYHPQNIFRLVTKSRWHNFRQECYYKVNRYILSNAKERSESNGILLFNRYQDGDNLYYTGLRVDGTVVIKKKQKGNYFTMAQKIFYPGAYNRKKKPNLLPINRWIGVRSEVREGANGIVSIKVYVDKNRSGEWVLALEAVDNGRNFGGAAIRSEGYAGIRTDFMDVEFDDYNIEEITE